MSIAQESYQSWLSHPELSANLLVELKGIKSAEEIEDRFYKNLEFGTGGLRGVLGAGTNRMNIYTVRKATYGLAQYLLAKGAEIAQQGVVIGYDCRHMSPEFAEEIGLVLAAQGIPAYIFEHLCPTPELSFSVRTLGTAAGVMVTASHNPPEYNGYKVYGSDGGQVLPDEANKIIDKVESISDIFAIPVFSKEEAVNKGLLRYVGAALDEQYTAAVLEAVKQGAISPEQRKALKIVYTPLHGTGNVPVQQVLQQAGYPLTSVVASQEQPDGDFSTVQSPNPEEPEALALAIQDAKYSGADIVMGTDPDADRVGVAVRQENGEFALMTGNQVGGLLVDFVLKSRSETRTLPSNGIVFKTIVTSELGAQAARRYGMTVEDTLTGFKYIGDRIGHYEVTGEHTFVFGYEESYGYLASPIVRDKDAVQICLLIAEMAAYYKAQSKTLLDALEGLFKQVGYFKEELVSAKLPGVDGMAKIRGILDGLREQGLTVPGMTVEAVEDYQTGLRTEWGSEGEKSGQLGENSGPWTNGGRQGNSAGQGSRKRESQLTLPKENVLKYFFTDGSWLAIRPSGTEPKIKVYIGAKGDSAEKCETALAKLRSSVRAVLEA